VLSLSPCCTRCNSPIELVTENKSTLRILNSNRLTFNKCKVDGCLIRNGIRCDWLLTHDEAQRESYVELKGADVEHAVKQIVRSVQQLTSNPRAKKTGYIICTRSPLSSPKIQLLSKRLLRDHNIVLRVKKTVCEESIESVFLM